MKLSEKDRIVLSVVEMRARSTITQIAKASGFRPSTVQYTLKRLRERGIIGERKPMIDLNRLGYTHYTTFVALSSDGKELLTKLRAVAEYPEVTWLFEIAGRFQYGISITVRHVSEVVGFLDKLSHLFGDSLMERCTCTQCHFEYYGRKYLSDIRLKPPRLRFDFAADCVEIDAVDRLILSSMGEEGSQSLESLAKKTALPVSTLDRRRRDLETRGIISSYYYWIRSDAIGRVCYIFRITCRGAPEGLRKRLFDYAARERDTIYAIACIGPWDYELGAELSNAAAVVEMTQRICATFKRELLSVEPVPVLRYLLIKGFPGT